MPLDPAIPAVELKLDVRAPARGQRLFVLGRVSQQRCNACACRADGYMWADGLEPNAAQTTATVMAISGSLVDACQDGAGHTNSGARSGDTKAILAAGSDSAESE